MIYISNMLKLYYDVKNFIKKKRMVCYNDASILLFDFNSKPKKDYKQHAIYELIH